MDSKAIALKNISNYGDTDIFPFPVENMIFHDCFDKSKDLLNKIENEFSNFIQKYPVDKESLCIPVGLGGFRWATQIDPIWNAYFLSLVLDLSGSIEKKRISADKDTIYSYRLSIDESTGKLFSKEISWRKFISDSINIAGSGKYSHVVKFDISDFYTRIYHHRLENALIRTEGDREKIKRVMTILQNLSSNASYGLPIGGNASRLLAEALLHSIDQYLFNKKIRFCRFVDDFVLFAESKEDAFRFLNTSAEFLLRNEGLAIQKTKTQLLSVTEYISQTKHLLFGEEDELTSLRASFLNLHIYYDPYSITAEDDYKSLKSKILSFDVIGLLQEEMRKSRIHQAIGKQILNAISYLDDEKIGLSFKTISSNYDIFYPIFPSVLQVASKSITKAPIEYQNDFMKSLCDLVDKDSYIVQSDNTLAYLVRVLSRSELEESSQTIDSIFNKTSSPMVKANCIYAMTNKRMDFWLSDKKSNFVTMSRQEKRAFIIASYFLGDEGTHWRNHTKNQFLDLEVLTRDWVSNKITNKHWKLPI